MPSYSVLTRSDLLSIQSCVDWVFICCSDYDHMHSSTLFVTVIKHLDKKQIKDGRSVSVQHWGKSDQELKHELQKNTNCWLLSTSYNASFSHRLILSLLSLVDSNPSDHTIYSRVDTLKYNQDKNHSNMVTLANKIHEIRQRRLFFETTWH